MASFDLDSFVAECRKAIDSESTPHLAVKEIVERAVADPAAVVAAMGMPRDNPSIMKVHHSEDLTILHIVWPPDVDLFAHDHNMWASIGLYGGREDNSFFRRTPDSRIEQSGLKELYAKDVVLLGDDTVHSVRNPSNEWTGAFHVYGGDFFNTPRTMWRADTLDPAPFDYQVTEKVLTAARTAALES